jgi:protein transport protein SEC24|tara:strand:+ start:112 stop:651 length:540 start_codon:yes stop_codon:yes gene_type:complete
MKAIGGKMMIFNSTLPSLGDGQLKPRENPRIMGTPEEFKLLKPETTWYKDTAVEFSRAQIAVDLFLFPQSFTDVASLGELPKQTSGTLHTYPSFNYETDGERFGSELDRVLTRRTVFETVMRVRVTRGMRISNFYGNFFIRGADLLALPNCTEESAFGFDIQHDEPMLCTSVITIQSGE